MSIRLSSLTLPGYTDIKESPLPVLRNSSEHISVEQADNVPKDIADGFGKFSGSRVLPYKMQNHYHRSTDATQLLTVVFENDIMRATFLPEYGGRLYSLYNKELEKELLSVNPVFQPANLATRNAWFSGGIEWNMAHYGHTFMTCEPLFFASCTDEDGETFLRMYEYERCKKLFYQIDFHLPQGADHLITYTKIINPYDHETPVYYWSNTAVSELHSARVFSGTDEVIYVMPYLDDKGKMVNVMGAGNLPYLHGIEGDVSYPRNFERSNEYFYQNPSELKYPWEAVGYDDGSLFYECSTQPLRYRKMFCWGTHKGGTKWQDYLSHGAEDKYVEVQAGLYPTQLHSNTMGPNCTIAFMQIYGLTMVGDKQRLFGEHSDSTDYVHDTVFTKHNDASLQTYEAKAAAASNLPVGDILTKGSGWGALEMKRAGNEGARIHIPSMEFPESSMNDDQGYWLSLMDGEFESLKSLDTVAMTYMIDGSWLKHLDRQLDESSSMSEDLLLHKALILSENNDDEGALHMLESNLSKDASLLYLRTIGAIHLKLEQHNDALIFFTKAFDRLPYVTVPFLAEDFLDEFMTLLLEMKHFEMIWRIYQELIAEGKAVTEEMSLSIACAAYELEQFTELDSMLKNASPERHREGNNVMVELWFKRQADLQVISVDEARETLTPPDNIDFRMS